MMEHTSEDRSGVARDRGRVGNEDVEQRIGVSVTLVMNK
jgi:hypothetical protein